MRQRVLFDRYIGIDYSGFFEPNLTRDERAIAEIEGWILGVK